MEIKKDVEIKVISQEESLKILGELLSNETSRNLMRFLMNKSAYKKKISDETKLAFPLVEHHLKKMEKLGLVKITNKKLIKGGVPHKTYKITADGIFLMLNTTDEEIEKNSVIKKAFKSGIKFVGIGIVALISWTILPNDNFSMSDSQNVDVGIINITLIIIIIGLVIERIFTYKKNKN